MISIFRGVAAALALTLCGCTGAPPSLTPSFGPVPAPTDSLDFTMHSFMDQGAAAVVAEIRWPGGSWSRAYGVRDLDSNEPIQPDDLVSVASITKSMTAVSVMKLVDEGLIGLDDPVNGILGSFTTVLSPPGPITVRQLLSHTSAMPTFQQVSEKSVEDVRSVVTEEMTTQRALELTATLPWEARNVGSFRYSDSGYLVLGQLLEKLCGKPYLKVLEDDVIDPLQLRRTFIDRDLRGASDMVHGYITLRGERLDVTQAEVDKGAAFGGAVSTVSDVKTFFGALFRGDLVSDASLNEMKKSGSDFSDYGLGIWKFTQGCTGEYRYGGKGGLWGYRTIAIGSTDGQHQASMTLVPPPIPTSLEEPESDNRLNLWDDQMASALQETLDRLCP